MTADIHYFKNDRTILDTIGSTTVAIEPWWHPGMDHRAFKRSSTPGCEDLFEWCHVSDWNKNGERARFYALHPGVRIPSTDLL